MDTLSHGLWGGIAFGRKAKRDFWLAISFGLAPDFLSFGVFLVSSIIVGGFTFDHQGPPDLATVPSYVFTLYDITHSLIVSAVVFLAVWFVRKKPLIPMLAWPLHILIDIPTHGIEFFPTPFLWPLSDYRFDGISWGHPYIFFTNIALLALAYAWFLFKKLRQRGG
jgi:hypothetical protein